MYSTCIFCYGALGLNTVLEQFPVGRRLAYDERRGRLWVICPYCARWNLSPIESRWEVIEHAERAFRSAAVYAATDNISLARRSGLELVRIGEALPVELSGWRYGRHLVRRRRRYFAAGAAGTAITITPLLISMLGVSTGVGAAVAGALLAYTGLGVRNEWRDHKVPAIFLGSRGAVIPMTKYDTWSATLIPQHDGRAWSLSVRHRPLDLQSSGTGRLRTRALPLAPEAAILAGREAERALSQLLPHANPIGASMRRVREAVQFSQGLDSIGELISAAIAEGGKGHAGSPLTRLPASIRLGLEIAVHQKDEQEAEQGRLGFLEKQWRAAEEMAAIADSLLVPAALEERLQRLRALLSS